jgi:hypothetical protein
MNPFNLRKIADDLTAVTVNLAVGLATGAVLAESVWRVIKAL